MENTDRVPSEEVERAAQDGVDRISRLRRTAQKIDTSPALLAAARRVRKRLPGDDRFGDALSTAGATPVEVVARSVSALSPERESVAQELGLAGLQLWQSLSEAAGRGRGDVEIAILFTDLVGFSSWALEAGDAATLDLLREVGAVEEAAVLAHNGRIVKRLGDGLMATFLDAQEAVETALDVQEALQAIEVAGFKPRIRAGVHWGRPRKLGGDFLGVDVNIAARVAEAAKANQVMVSDPVLQKLSPDSLQQGKRKRLRSEGAPREMHITSMSRA
jgi:class 3 adenylate cyclase